MCSSFTPDSEYDQSTIILSGNVYCLNTKCSGKLCLHKKTFQSLGRSDYQCPQCKSVCQVRNIPFEDQTNSFSCRLFKGFTFLKRAQNQFKILLEICIVLASSVPTEKNTNLLTDMQQLRDPFMVVESVEPGCSFTKFLFCYKSTQRRHKQTKHAFSLLKKDELVTRQTIITWCPISIKQL